MGTFRTRSLLASCVLLPFLVAPVSAQDLAEAALPCPELAPGPARTAVRIIDGETLALDDGSELRLIGALAPRAIDVGAEAGRWPAENRTRQELQDLVAGKSLALAFGGDRTDRYGRLQAHAFVTGGGQRRWVQGHLLEQGLARAYVLAGNRACAKELLEAERGAREARRGLWAEAAYKVRSASRAAELAGYHATFQLIEGHVARVSTVRGTVYLNFDRDWRQGFSALLRSGDQVVLGAPDDSLRGLQGRQVRLRGWVEGSRAPRMDLSISGLVEVVGAHASSGR